MLSIFIVQFITYKPLQVTMTLKKNVEYQFKKWYFQKFFNKISVNNNMKINKI